MARYGQVFAKEGFATEAWFQRCARQLRILDRLELPVKAIARSIRTHLPRRYQSALANLSDPHNPGEWLDLALRTDALIRLEDLTGRSWLISVDLTLDERQSQIKLAEINRQDFRAVRSELGIDCHWVLLFGDSKPGLEDLTDLLYQTIDQCISSSNPCQLVDARHLASIAA